MQLPLSEPEGTIDCSKAKGETERTPQDWWLIEQGESPGCSIGSRNPRRPCRRPSATAALLVCAVLHSTLYLLCLEAACRRTLRRGLGAVCRRTCGHSLSPLHPSPVLSNVGGEQRLLRASLPQTSARQEFSKTGVCMKFSRLLAGWGPYQAYDAGLLACGLLGSLFRHIESRQADVMNTHELLAAVALSFSIIVQFLIPTLNEDPPSPK